MSPGPKKPGNRSREHSPNTLQRSSDLDLVQLLNSSDDLSSTDLGGGPQFAVLQMLRFIANSQTELTKSLTAN